MPYFPINKCGLPTTVDIRLQHRFSDTGKNLSRKTYFNKTEAVRLLQMHYMLIEENGFMDKMRFVQFMEVFLGLNDVEAVEKLHLLGCKTNKTYLTGAEFVSVLSLLLKGTLQELIDFWFEPYTENIMPTIYKDDLNAMITEDWTNLSDHHQDIYHNKYFGGGISLEDHRTFLNAIVAELELLQSVLPMTDRKMRFVRLFSNRPYFNGNRVIAHAGVSYDSLKVNNNLCSKETLHFLHNQNLIKQWTIAKLITWFSSQ